MKKFSSISSLAALLLLGIFSSPHANAAGKDGGVNGAFTYSTDPALSASQHQVKATIETYQKGLDSSNTPAILSLFAPNAVIEWIGKSTVVGKAGLTAPYVSLFKELKFTTQFQYDAVDVYGGDIALVRTHHLKGQTERHIKDGSQTLDFNRELFILQKIGPSWKIIFYSFNTQPQQGVQ